jgi:hypothetical protein
MRRRTLLIGGAAALAVPLIAAPILLAPGADVPPSPEPPSIDPEEHARTIAAMRPPKRERPVIAIVAFNAATEVTDLLGRPDPGVARPAERPEGGDALGRMRGFAGFSVDHNASYVVDGEVWTSAGVTTGIDMALAMVERDHGAALAGDIAKRLVVYARRPGHQSQFSALLSAQVLADNPFAELIDWMQGQLDGTLDGPTLARKPYRAKLLSQVSGGDRTNSRAVRRIPADRRRMDAVRALSIKAVAAQVGMDPRRLNAAFERRFRMSAQLYRTMHAQS